jgi:hypothetical protein
MLERALNPNDIVGLLSKLKAKTPDYSPDMMAARRAAFVNQAIAIKFDGPKQGGKGGGDGGSSSMGGSSGSGALGGTTTAQGVFCCKQWSGLGSLPGCLRLLTRFATRSPVCCRIMKWLWKSHKHPISILQIHQTLQLRRPLQKAHYQKFHRQRSQTHLQRRLLTL